MGSNRLGNVNICDRSRHCGDYLGIKGNNMKRRFFLKMSGLLPFIGLGKLPDFRPAWLRAANQNKILKVETLKVYKVTTRINGRNWKCEPDTFTVINYVTEDGRLIDAVTLFQDSHLGHVLI